MTRRMFDVTMAGLALVVLALPLLIVAVAIKLSSSGPVMYCGKRSGQDGRPFVMYKFRTMTATAVGPSLTPDGDPRVTRVGGVLRRWKIDELPQLWNVLRGEMSIIGPRPEVEQFVACYSPIERRILGVKPGLASVAQLLYRHESRLLSREPDPEAFYIREMLPRKLAADLAYERGRTMVSDIRLLLRLVFTMLGKGARARG